MVTSQPRRSGAVQAWWARTGSTNRGFVSLDPERQCEVDCGRPAPRRATGNAFSFDVSAGGAGSRAGRGAPRPSKTTAPDDGAAAAGPGRDEGRKHKHESGSGR